MALRPCGANRTKGKETLTPNVQAHPRHCRSRHTRLLQRETRPRQIKITSHGRSNSSTALFPRDTTITGTAISSTERQLNRAPIPAPIMSPK